MTNVYQIKDIWKSFLTTTYHLPDIMAFWSLRTRRSLVKPQRVLDVLRPIFTPTEGFCAAWSCRGLVAVNRNTRTRSQCSQTHISHQSRRTLCTCPRPWSSIEPQTLLSKPRPNGTHDSSVSPSAQEPQSWSCTKTTDVHEMWYIKAIEFIFCSVVEGSGIERRVG